MKKFTLLLIALLITMTAGAELRSGHFFKSFKRQNISAVEAVSHFAQWFALPEGTEWREVSRSTDQLGMERIEYRQYVSGVEVENSQVLLHVKDGRVKSANGTVMEAMRTPGKLRSMSIVYKDGTPTTPLGHPLYIAYTHGGYRYATKVLSADHRYWVYADPESGEIMKRIPTRQTLGVEGTPEKITGSSLYSGDVTLDGVRGSDGFFYLYDPQRNIHTFNASQIPSVGELIEMEKLYDYMPQLDLPDDYQEINEENFQAWNNQLMTMIENEEVDLSKYLQDFTSYLGTKGNVLDAYKLNSVTIDRLMMHGEDGQPVPIETLSGYPAKVRFEIRYGATPGVITKGSIENIPFEIRSLPIRLNLSNFQELIPNEGVTLMFTMVKTDKYGWPLLDEDDDPIVDTLQVLQFIPDESGLAAFDNDFIKISLNYEKSSSPLADIHWGMARTLDFFKEFFGREGYDGKNSPVYNLVYLSENDDEDLLACDRNNAAAISSLLPRPMVYGMGGYSEGMKDFDSRPIVEISVMSHEFTHIVTQVTANLVYQGEAGALNESFSDLMGISVKKYVQGNDATWTIGDGTDINQPYIRDMANPKNSNCPGTYQGQHWVNTESSYDNGGVHINSGVQNKWYFLLSDGGSGTNDNDEEYNVTGIGLDHAQQIAYRTLVVYATNESQYADIRLASLQAAEDLYGENSNEVKTVAQAWDAVGVYDGSISDGISLSTVDARKTEGTRWYTLDGRRLNGKPSAAGIYVFGNQKVVIN